MKRPSDITARIWIAVRRIESRGERPTCDHVIAELKQLFGSGCSYREVAPVVEQWRAEVVAKAERRISAAVAALGKLEHDLEWVEVVRRFRGQFKRHLTMTPGRTPGKCG